MTGQLSLGFALALPRAGGVAPTWAGPRMGRVRRRAPFDSPDHLFEPAWGGHRVLVFLEPAGAMRVVNSAGLALTPYLPELQGLRPLMTGRSAVIDGGLA